MRSKRFVHVYLVPLEWRLWPFYSKGDPGKLFVGPIVVRWWVDYT